VTDTGLERVAGDAAPVLDRVTRLGFATKGLLTILVGVLALRYALGRGGRLTGQEGAIRALLDQPFGQVALVVLTVGTDCNVGKMTAQLQLTKKLNDRGIRTRFVPTGQTGIMIEGWGIAVDAVVADFIAGAAEWLTLEGSKNADVVLVEGQGSINHPGYSGVTLGLLHGSCPDAMILCHQSTREYIGDYRAAAWLRIPPLTEYVRLYESIGAAVHPTRVIGISLNTYDLSDVEARRACDQAQRETGLPVTDPVRFDPAPLVSAIAEERERYLRRRKAL